MEMMHLLGQLLSHSLDGTVNSAQQLCHQAQATAECIGLLQSLRAANAAG